METSAGLTGPLKPAITPCSTLKVAILTVADNIFITILQKRENQLNLSSRDIMKTQVGENLCRW